MAEQQQGTQASAPANRGIKLLLALSLTLNMVVIGVLVGAGLRHGADARATPPPPVRGAMNDLGFGPLLQAFPRERRREIGRQLRAQAGAFVDNRAELEREVDEMLSALRAVPYDPADLQAVMDRQQARLSQRIETGRVLLLDEIAAMSDAERAKFAARLEESLARARAHVREHPPMPPTRP